MRPPARLTDRWTRISRFRRDSLGALLLVALTTAEVLVSDLSGPLLGVLTQSVVIAGATAWRRESPLGAIVAAVVAGSANPLIYTGTAWDFVVTQTWAVLLLSYSVAAYEERTESAVAGPLLLLAAFWADNLRQQTPPGEYLASFVGVAAAWCAGRAVFTARRSARRLREAYEELDRQRRLAEESAVEAERLRIARELHDVVAHSLTVVALQADAADALLPGRPEPAQRAVVAIRGTAREALDEMRRLLGTLRPDAGGDEDDGGPGRIPGGRGLRDLETLVASSSPDGRSVSLEVDGADVALPPALDRAAYRVLQEGLTNARRHGDGSGCRVRVRYRPDAVELCVENTPGAGRTRGSGLGLVGVRERVAALGGSMSAGVEQSGVWTLRARLPLDPAGTAAAGMPVQR